MTYANHTSQEADSNSDSNGASGQSLGETSHAGDHSGSERAPTLNFPNLNFPTERTLTGNEDVPLWNVVTDTNPTVGKVANEGPSSWGPAPVGASAAASWTPWPGADQRTTPTPPPPLVATYELPSSASKNALKAVLVVVVGSIAAAATVDRLAQHVRSGSWFEFLINVASLAVGDGIVITALYMFATRRGVRTRDIGVRAPSDKSQAVVLAIATWLVFMIGAATWVAITTPIDELRAQQTRISNDPTVSVPFNDSSDDANTTEFDRPVTDLSSDGVANESVPKARQDNRHALVKVLQDDPPVRLVILILVTACLLAPLVEELFFRGYLFSVLASRLGPVAAMFATGTLFGLAHFAVVPPKILPVLALLGVALGWLRHQTGSVVPGIAVHAFVNSLASGISAGLGMHTLTLIVGSWLVLLALLYPLLRRNSLVRIA